MSCTTCCTKFGFMNKECFCSKCGYLFCKRCLISRNSGNKNPEKQHLCKSCSNFSTPECRSSKAHCDPVIEYKLPSTLHYSQAAKDRDIHERLEHLRKERMGQNRQVSQQELEERLHRLKDEPIATSNMQVVPSVDQRTEAEKAGSLISQLQDEVRIDAMRPPPEVEIAERLARLKDIDLTQDQRANEATDVNPSEFLAATKSADNSEQGHLTENLSVEQIEKLIAQTSIAATVEAQSALKELQNDGVRLTPDKTNSRKGDEDYCASTDDEVEADQVMNQILEEDKLESYLSQLNDPPCEPSEDSALDLQNLSGDELPWCCICNADASIRCIGCEGDLFCRRCYKEGHDTFDLKDHRTIPFKRRLSANFT